LWWSHFPIIGSLQCFSMYIWWVYWLFCVTFHLFCTIGSFSTILLNHPAVVVCRPAAFTHTSLYVLRLSFGSLNILCFCASFCLWQLTAWKASPPKWPTMRLLWQCTLHSHLLTLKRHNFLSSYFYFSCTSFMLTTLYKSQGTIMDKILIAI